MSIAMKNVVITGAANLVRVPFALTARLLDLSIGVGITHHTLLENYQRGSSYEKLAS